MQPTTNLEETRKKLVAAQTHRIMMLCTERDQAILERDQARARIQVERQSLVEFMRMTIRRESEKKKPCVWTKKQGESYQAGCGPTSQEQFKFCPHCARPVQLLDNASTPARAGAIDWRDVRLNGGKLTAQEMELFARMIRREGESLEPERKP